MTLEEQLAQYRQRYSFNTAKAEDKNAVSPWDGEIESLKGEEEMDKETVWADEISSDMNTTFSPSRQDYDDFVQGMMGDERVMKHQDSINAALEELMTLVNDPSNPMDVEQAQQLFTQLMEQNVYSDFQDDGVETAPIKKGKK